MIVSYVTTGVCAREIKFEVENGIVKYLAFIGGCPGNLNAISKLVQGMPVVEVVQKLRGNLCRNNTSCADQLAQALEAYIAKTAD